MKTLTEGQKRYRKYTASYKKYQEDHVLEIRAQRKLSREVNIEKRRAQDILKVNKYNKKYPERQKAKDKLHSKVRNGLIVRATVCDLIGLNDIPCNGRIEGHHYLGYKFWNEVQWLCKNHHEKAHHNRVTLNYQTP